MKSTNPFLKNASNVVGNSNANFTARGALNKTMLGIAIMIAIVVISSTSEVIMSVLASLYLPLAIGLTVALIFLGIRAYSDVSKAKTLFFTYSIIEGCLLSVIVYIANLYVPGIGITAAIITFLIVIFMYVLYNVAPGLIQTLTPIFLVGMSVLGVLMLLNFVLSIFGLGFLPYDSMFFIILLLAMSSFSIAVDFRQIDIMNHYGLDKEYEWLGAFGLLTSIVWTFINVLRLLLARNND